jgi:hypothetical protein
VTAFTHVVDCRPVVGDGAANGYDCSGRRAGNLYQQYWFYYPGSATAEGSLPGAKQGIRWASTKLGKPSFHRDDWESYQIRIGPDARAFARASAHRGYKYEIGDADSAFVSGVRSERGGARRLVISRRRGPGHWGPSNGYLYASSGSHAGNALADREVDRTTPGGRTRLIPLEAIALRERASFAVVPPWLKHVWRDPESEGTT